MGVEVWKEGIAQSRLAADAVPTEAARSGIGRALARGSRPAPVVARVCSYGFAQWRICYGAPVLLCCYVYPQGGSFGGVGLVRSAVGAACSMGQLISQTTN